MGRIFNGRQRSADMMLSRFGVEVTIERPDGTSSTNEYGKTDDSTVTYTTVGSEPAVRWYRSRDDNPSSSRVTGGRVDTENPWLFASSDTEIQEGDRIEFADTNEQYVVDTKVPRQTHNEFRVTFVNG